MGKNDFIQNVLNQSGFNRYRFVLCAHTTEWDAAKHFRDKYFFTSSCTDDPYIWTLKHSEHAHLVLYKGTEIIGYTHIQFLPESRSVIRIIVVDENQRNQNAGSRCLALSEKWLRSLGIKSIHAESRESSLKFYLKNGYTKMPFDYPEGKKSDIDDIQIGKIL
ncbi:GNAT family N-acetyltransferase [Candidatus Lariskella endosymbiont of Hedychridium roseum]|uniref:GNAT family N-acetyltransferase n=1 Tax=Candidatus Lariskella endosymbiont of Hedychridium roseum TaxID=3077949 RepID=UPI0030CD02C8